MKRWKEDENGKNGDRSPGVGRKGKGDTHREDLPDYSSGGPQTDINSTDRQTAETDRQTGRQIEARHPGS